ncbi:HERV-H LTR-associating protein 1 [Vipera latastei]
MLKDTVLSLNLNYHTAQVDKSSLHEIMNMSLSVHDTEIALSLLDPEQMLDSTHIPSNDFYNVVQSVKIIKLTAFQPGSLSSSGCPADRRRVQEFVNASSQPLSQYAASAKRENKKEERVVVMATAELPAKLVDLAALNLTGMVNGMLNTALRGTKEFFSLLSIVSYSSYAFHKVSIVLYNISSLRNIDPTKFSTRYCYCLNNRTNDLTDFTALLVDIVGNSTSYLTEIFKSTSIVSVSQSNDTDCIYICAMSGRIGRNLTDLWEAIDKSPIVNYTFSGNISDFLECTQVIKKGNLVTVPPLTVQKLNPCVMELCKFYQRCFCTRDRSYSRDHAMRYCVENYPWFFKNAGFICEKVKRSTYSKSK